MKPALRTVPERLSLRGRTAVVTGGSRGRGLQIAKALGEQGARVLGASDAATHLTGQVPAVDGAVSAV